MTLLRELIDIPEHVQKGDFVLRLSEGVIDPAGTLNEYVVTPELVKCFNQALDFIREAVTRRTSKATYLHGSFGSGKSHFMAVLHLILQGNSQARGIPELAGVIAKHNDWLQGKKFLLVPYHMIGAHSMESGVFGGYVDFIRRTHPQAPVPGVFLAERLFDDARHLRQKMGDGPFFDGLNAAPGGGGARGRLGGAGVGLGRRSVRVRDGGRPRLRGADPPGQRPRRHLLPLLQRAGRGAAGSLPVDGQGPVRAQPARPRPRLRRPVAVPRRADPVAGHAVGGPGLRQAGGGQADQPGRGPDARPTHPDCQLRGPAAGPPQADRRPRRRGRAAQLQ